MLLWWLNGSKQNNFFLKIFFISVLLHFTLLTYFFLSKKKSLSLTVKNNFNYLKVPIVFSPLKKTTGQLNSLNDVLKKDLKKNNKKIILNKNQIKQNSVLKTKSSIEKKDKVSKNKKSHKKEKIKEKIEKIQKKVEEKKEIEKIKENNIEESKQPVTENKINAIELGRKDLEILEIQNNVTQSIRKGWKPPTGFSKNLECIVRILIDANGNVVQFKFEKSSKILVFDMSIKRDIVKVVFPKEVCNQELLLTLKNE